MLPLIFFVVGILAQQTFADEPEAIVGGQSAALGEFPHQCSLQVNGRHNCGGSIISNTKVLSAAHCTSGIVFSPYNNFKIRTGSIYSQSSGQLHDVRNVVNHPQFSNSQRESWKNDVCVITLLQPMQFNQYQKPIALARSLPTAGQRCTLSGWGMIWANGPLSSNLLKMDQAIVSPAQCQNIHSNMPMGPSHLCALNRRGIGACQGDSGGPLICNGVQYGITSWVSPCALGYPDVYCSVAYVYPWIISQ